MHVQKNASGLTVTHTGRRGRPAVCHRETFGFFAGLQELAIQLVGFGVRSFRRLLLSPSGIEARCSFNDSLIARDTFGVRVFVFVLSIHFSSFVRHQPLRATRQYDDDSKLALNRVTFESLRCAARSCASRP